MPDIRALTLTAMMVATPDGSQSAGLNLTSGHGYLVVGMAVNVTPATPELWCSIVNDQGRLVAAPVGAFTFAVARVGAT